MQAIFQQPHPRQFCGTRPVETSRKSPHIGAGTSGNSPYVPLYGDRRSNTNAAGSHPCPSRPETGFGLSEEVEHGSIEERRLLQIDRVPTLRQHEQPCRWYVPLQEHRWIHGRLFLIANDEQRRDVQPVERILERKRCRRPRLPARDCKRRDPSGSPRATPGGCRASKVRRAATRCVPAFRDAAPECRRRRARADRRGRRSSDCHRMPRRRLV
jgi:hypothetical protein